MTPTVSTPTRAPSERCIARLVALPLLALLVLAPLRGAGAQDGPEQAARTAPRFLLATATSRTVERAPAGPEEYKVIDVSKTPLLRRRLSLVLDGVTLQEALARIGSLADVQLVYSKEVVPLRQKVHLVAEEISLAGALTEVLVDANVDVVLTLDGQLVLRKREDAVAVPAPGVIVGRVTDRANGRPVGSVQLLVVGNQLGAITDDDGRYSLRNVPVGRWQLRAQRIGYQPQTHPVAVGDGATVTADFTLSAAVPTLETVVATATGEQARKAVGNAITSISADSVTRYAPVVSMANLLSGRAANVQVLTSAGVTGAGSRIRIRGLNSVSLVNDPMVLVDGVRIDVNPSSYGNGTGQTIGRINRLDDLIPDEVESMEIVRGPSAATLYGTDAANGVVIIKTKRAIAGPPRWDLWTEEGQTKIPGDFPQAYYAWGKSTTTGAVQQCLLTDAALGRCTRDSISTFNPFTTPDVTGLQDGSRQSYGVQLAGGPTASRFFLSGIFEREMGPFKMPDAEIARITTLQGVPPLDEQIHPNALRKASVRGNFFSEVSPTFDFGLNMGVLANHFQIPNTTWFGENFQTLGYRTALDGGRSYPPGDLFQLMTQQNIDRFTGALTANWRPFSWLTAHSTTGADIGARYDELLQRPGEGWNISNYRLGRRLIGRTSLEHYTIDAGGTAQFTPKPWLGSRTSVGMQYFKDRSLTTNANGTQLSPGGTTVGAGAVRDASEATVESGTLGFFVEQTFSLRERLYVTGALRNDNNSAFGRNLKSVIYPKASLSWLLLEEPWMPKPPGISSARVRVAYGESGVQPTPTAALVYYTPFAAVVDGTEQGALRLAGLGDPNLKPERSHELEAGLDFGILNERATFELTYFDKESRDALISVPIPPSVGAGTTSRFQNLGSVQNKGYELTVHLKLADGPRFGWTATLAGSRTDNKLLTLGPGIPPIVLGVLKQRQVPGYPIFSNWDRPILGYSDANNNGIIEESEVQVGTTEAYMGSVQPTREASLNNSISLLNDQLRIGAQFDYKGGWTPFNQTEYVRCSTSLNCRAVNDPTASLADQAAAVVARSANFGRSGAGYMQDGTMVRFRELSATYFLPQRWAQAAHSRDASITLSGRNLALWKKYPGLDPEGTNNGGDYIADQFTIPQQRLLLARVNLSF